MTAVVLFTIAGFLIGAVIAYVIIYCAIAGGLKESGLVREAQDVNDRLYDIQLRLDRLEKAKGIETETEPNDR